MASVPRSAGATPAMAQWFAAKEAHPDALVFFRMGDFYELFFADAEAAAAALDIALTQRGEHDGTPIPMCGVPEHAAEAYLARLIRRGFRVAVAEQMEDPKTRTGKAPIRREVVRLITPGTLTEDALLEAGRPNLLLALAQAVSTARRRLARRLHRPVRDQGAGRRPTCPACSAGWSRRRSWRPQPLRSANGRTSARPTSCRRRPWSPAAGWPRRSASPASMRSAASPTPRRSPRSWRSTTCARPRPARCRGSRTPSPQGEAGLLAMDAATRASLEIHRARDGGTLHTLLGAVQRTLTPAGARMLADGWRAAHRPGRDRGAAGCLGVAAGRTRRRRALRAALRAAPDIARALARLSVGRGGPRDLAALRDGLRAARAAAAALRGNLSRSRGGVLSGHCQPNSSPPVPPSTSIRPLNSVSPCPGRSGAAPAGRRHAIRAGFDAELDAERALRDDSRRVLATLQLDYAQRYGVASLKIRHHAQLGYVIEAPAAAVEKLRDFPN